MNPRERLAQLPSGPGLRPLLQFVDGFEDPRAAAGEVLRLLDRAPEDEYVAPPGEFARRPSGSLFERWEYLVNAFTLFEVEEGRLLSLPPGSDRFATYRSIMPRIVQRHLDACFPRLKAELANRPNLFYPGVYYPDEISLRNMEMISLHHGRNYVVRADLDLEDHPGPVTVALKPAPMGVEAVVTSLLDELNRRMPPPLRSTVGPVEVPEIVGVEDQYGILEYLPGSNGVEVLPRGINTGTLRTLRSNEYPEDFSITRNGVLDLVDEFAKQAVLAFYLRLYDRKPDQLMLRRRRDGGYDAAHIDFGRSVKRNFALPWRRYYATQKAPLLFEDHQIPYFEAATSLIFLPHFIPDSLRDELSPFQDPIRTRLRTSFVRLARFVRDNVNVVHEHLQYLVGARTQFSEDEVLDRHIEARDVREVRAGLLALEPDPKEVVESVINLARLERSGDTPTRPAGELPEDSVYLRGVRSGRGARRIEDRRDEEPAYHLRRYDRGNRVFYDPDSQTLEVTFGEHPDGMLDHLRRRLSPSLARFLSGFPTLISGAVLRIRLDGGGSLRLPSGWVRRDVDFPTDALQEVRQAVEGFASPHHVKNYVSSYRTWREGHPEADFPARELKRQGMIFANSLEGQEILQCYREIVGPEDPLHGALSEVIRQLLSNPQYLADKDPLKSINDLVVHLGQRHELVPPLGDRDHPPDGPESLYRTAFRVYNRSLSAGAFPERPHPALARVRGMIRLGEMWTEGMGPKDRRLFRCAVLLHDLYLRDPHLLQLRMDPNGRSHRPLIQEALADHPLQSRRELEELLAGGVSPPDGVSARDLLDLLENHHPDRWRAGGGGVPDHLRELLHVTDRLVDYADRTRPARWNQGFVQLEQLAPSWIRTQLERHDLDSRTERRLRRLLDDPPAETLRSLDRITTPYQTLASAVHMAGVLHHGLNPRNPDQLNELRNRHGRRVVDRIWERVLESNLPVGEKVRLIRRIDDLAQLFERLDDRDYAFVNASPHPIQHAQELIGRHLAERRIVILVGFFPRVTKAFRRFRDHNPDLSGERLGRLMAISGPRRLQFIRHSYPYEADFQRPFHHTIERYRRENRIQGTFCLIPFQEFFRSYAPAGNAARRIRDLEKASDLEEHHPPDRVRSEARRFCDWRDDRTDIDRIEGERLRRVLLNGFTNREVLYYYRETLRGDGGVREALKDVLGALHENPNYLSDRSSRYERHELIRSLSQIHFFPDHRRPVQERLTEILRRLGVERTAPLRRLVDVPGAEFDFLKHTFVSALSILSRMPFPRVGTSPFGMALGTLAPLLVCRDPAVRDYLLSPEDVSYHRALRRRLLDHEMDVPGAVKRCGLQGALSERHRSEFQELMEPGARPAARAATQTALFLAFYVDFSRVENWERGQYRITARDVANLLPTLNAALAGDEGLPESMAAWLREPSTIAFLNRTAEPSYAYIHLYNALNLSADLRYGLFPRGVDSFENVRRLYGTRRVDRVLEGIVRSRISVNLSVKIARKIRYLSAALQRMPDSPDTLRFTDLDRPAGEGEMDAHPTNGTSTEAVVLSGSCANVLARWRLRSGGTSRGSPRLYCLVGEEFPLFLKDTTLTCSGALRRRVRRHRREQDLEGRHRLIPARVLLENLQPALDDSLPPRHPGEGDPATAFLRAYLDLFEPRGSLLDG